MPFGTNSTSKHLKMKKKTKINNPYKASLLSIATMQDKSAIRKS
jgi:hypothetical protein